MGQSHNKDYLPLGYAEWLANILDRLRYTNSEAKMQNKLQDIVGADIYDLTSRYLGIHQAVTQQEFEALEADFRFQFANPYAVPRAEYRAPVQVVPTEPEGCQASYEALICKFVDWFAQAAIMAETAQTQQAGFTSTSTASETEFASINDDSIAIHDPSTLQLSRDEILAFISANFDEIFAAETRSEKLDQLRAHVIKECAEYWLMFHDAANPSAILGYRRALVSTAAEGYKLRVLAVYNHYRRQEAHIKTNGKDSWLMYRRDLVRYRLNQTKPGTKASIVRKLYETLVGAKIAAFWLNLSSQPIDAMVSYFDQHSPKDIGKMFVQAQGEFNLQEGVEDTLAYYSLEYPMLQPDISSL